MRRPVKPFVTEYKASNRRNAGAPGEQGVFESDRPAPKSFDFMLRPETEDSYDAAMRAADALFSIPASAKRIDADDPPGGDSSPQPHFDDGQPEISFPEKAGGRILRVLDEVPPPQYTALEAEHTPKRRGRKPGSKNKPKAVMAVDAAPIQEAMSPTPVHKVPVVTRPAIPAARKIAALAVPPAHKLPPDVDAAPNDSGAAPARGGQRFSWVRDTLKPGEDWKRRRLPRVCW